jgi:hypothetical protein
MSKKVCQRKTDIYVIGLYGNYMRRRKMGGRVDSFTVQGSQRWWGSVRGDTTLKLSRPVLNQYPTATVGGSVRAVGYQHSYSTKRIQFMPLCLHRPTPVFHDNARS